jgi:UDP-glucose 4-epimerase
MIGPDNRSRIVDVVTKFNPHVLIHLAVWEPDARVGTAHAKQLTSDASLAFFGAAAECPALDSIIVRSGIEIYGRARNSLTRPDESVHPNPTSEYGRMLEQLEGAAVATAARIGVSVGALRLAPVLGPHVPSPLGRLLRQPAVPFSSLADPPFTVVEDRHAARAFVAAAQRRVGEPVNVVAPGAITALQAIRRGRRLPVPLVGPEWALVRRLSHVLGAPIPEHVMEVMHRGRLADGSHANEALGVNATNSAATIVDRLYKWESVVRVTSPRAVA